MKISFLNILRGRIFFLKKKFCSTNFYYKIFFSEKISDQPTISISWVWWTSRFWWSVTKRGVYCCFAVVFGITNTGFRRILNRSGWNRLETSLDIPQKVSYTSWDRYWCRITRENSQIQGFSRIFTDFWWFLMIFWWNIEHFDDKPSHSWGYNRGVQESKNSKILKNGYKWP